MLMLLALKKSLNDRAWLIANDQTLVDSDSLIHLKFLWHQRLRGIPVAYLTGEKEFYGLRLEINADVLDPRDDTETLVDWALEIVRNQFAQTSVKIADLGTGSGAIALAIQHSWPSARVWATDASPKALAIARRNSEFHKLPVSFLLGSWCEPIGGMLFDLVVSNPPYIAANDPHLPALAHEPMQALVSGSDGLDDLRLIISQVRNVLNPGGWILLEHGHNQGLDVANLMREAGLNGIVHRKDLSGTCRCTGAQNPYPI